VIAMARQRKLADHVLIAVTHEHSGPMTWEDGMPRLPGITNQ
jgi:hypothetical protein